MANYKLIEENEELQWEINRLRLENKSLQRQLSKALGDLVSALDTSAFRQMCMFAGIKPNELKGETNG